MFVQTILLHQEGPGRVRRAVQHQIYGRRAHQGRGIALKNWMNYAVLRIRILDPVLFYPRDLDPGFRVPDPEGTGMFLGRFSKESLFFYFFTK
jgi:hypothetical protein